MKRAGDLIDGIADLDNLMLAFHKAAKGKRGRKEVIEYEKDLEDNLFRLSQDLLSASVRVGDYEYFQIRDPKLRTICAASFPERVLHHALMNVCHTHFERQFIHTTYATRPQKGTYKALDRARKAFKRYSYVAKFDVRHYFDSIDHTILKAKLARIFKDGAVLEVFGRIIDSYHSTQHGKGLPIGNLTSQYFANFYLSGFDHWCKETLKAKEYIRYMDDFLVFASDRDEIADLTSQIGGYIKANLDLELKPPVVETTKRGVSFLGYRLKKNNVLLNSRSKQRLGSKMALYESLLSKQIWNEQQYREHMTPLLSFSMYAHSKGLRRKIISTVANKRGATEFCAAVVGTTIRGTCGCRIATTTLPTTVTATTVCGLPSELRTLNG